MESRRREAGCGGGSFSTSANIFDYFSPCSPRTRHRNWCECVFLCVSVCLVIIIIIIIIVIVVFQRMFACVSICIY